MAENEFNDRDEQAVWELLARHRGIEPSFGFAERTLRRLNELPQRIAWWQWTAVRWAAGIGLAATVAAAGIFQWQRLQAWRAAEAYAAAHADRLEDFDVIAALDQLYPAANASNTDNRL
jgi:hypothetical protein